MMPKALSVIVLTLLCLVPQVLSGSTQIMQIDVRGNMNIDRDLILSVIPLKIGDLLTREMAAESIHSLYKLHVFNNVTISEEELSEGVRVIVDVEEYPIVETVEFSGYDELSESEVEDISGLRKGSYWSPFLQSDIRRRLLNKYAGENYHHAKVDFRAERLEGNRVAVDVEIDEGREITIEEIRFHGNRLVRARDIRDEMETTAASLFNSGKFEQDVFEKDLETIRKFFNSKGFIDARILSWEQKVINDEDMLIDIFLYEGEQFFFGDIILEGNEFFDDSVLMDQFEIEQDAVFNADLFQEQVRKIATLYYDEGYIYAGFDQELKKRGDRLDIVLKISENNRARIRKIHILGNRSTKEKIIRRQIIVHPGDYFSQSRIIDSQRRIYNLGFFEPDMYPDYEPINDNGDIDLYIHVQDKLSGSVNGGVGYNTQDNFVGQFSLTQDNLFGNAWSAKLSSEFGGSTTNFEFDFSNPYLYDTSTLGGLSLYHKTSKWSSYNYQVYSVGGGVRAGRPLGFLNFARLTVGYSLSSKKYEILDLDDEDTSDYLRELDSKDWQYNSNVTLSFTRDSRDNIFFPMSGTQFTLYQELAGGIFGGDFDYFKQISEVRWFQRLFWKVVLRHKWRFGYVTAYGDSDEVPPEERFYMGGTGANGIRGYADRSIGPNDGGHRAALFSTELAVPLAGDSVVGLWFFDAGDSYNRLEEFNLWKFKKGTGLGIRIRSPLGLIGFDYGYNLDQDEWEPHFQFGTTF